MKKVHVGKKRKLAEVQFAVSDSIPLKKRKIDQLSTLGNIQDSKNAIVKPISIPEHNTAKKQRYKKLKRRRRKRDPEKPKRPQTAFILFFTEKHRQFRNGGLGTPKGFCIKDNGRVDNIKFTKYCSSLWRKMSDKEKESYKITYRILLQQYIADCREYQERRKLKREQRMRTLDIHTPLQLQIRVDNPYVVSVLQQFHQIPSLLQPMERIEFVPSNICI